MAEPNPRRTFDFGARPHPNAAAAARYFDLLTRATVRGGDLTPAEWQAYGFARAAYVRCCLGLAQRASSSAICSSTPPIHYDTTFNRPRSRRPRVVLRESGVELVHDDEDRPPGPRLTTLELSALLYALAIAPPAFRRMALLSRGIDCDDLTPDALIGLDPDVAADLCTVAWQRFGPRVEDEAA